MHVHSIPIGCLRDTYGSQWTPNPDSRRVSTGIAQTKDGYLWIEPTEADTFDGFNFRPVSLTSSPSLLNGFDITTAYGCWRKLWIRPQAPISYAKEKRKFESVRYVTRNHALSKDKHSGVSRFRHRAGHFPFHGQTMFRNWDPFTPIISDDRNSDGKVWLGTLVMASFLTGGELPTSTQDCPDRKIILCCRSMTNCGSHRHRLVSRKRRRLSSARSRRSSDVPGLEHPARS